MFVTTREWATSHNTSGACFARSLRFARNTSRGASSTCRSVVRMAASVLSEDESKINDMFDGPMEEEEDRASASNNVEDVVMRICAVMPCERKNGIQES